MPAFLDKTPKTGKPLLDSILQSIGPDAVSTSILGGFAVSPLKEAARRFEHLVPESVKRIATERTKNRLARIFSEHSNDLPVQDRVTAIDIAGSDPIANLLIQDAIEVTDNVANNLRGTYRGVIGSYVRPQRGAAEMEMYAQAARSGSPQHAADLIRNLTTDFRRRVFNNPNAITLNKRKLMGGKEYAKTIVHEGTHGSHDRFGVLGNDPRLRPNNYPSQPIEWEANYAGNFQRDPISSDIPTMLQAGQRSMLLRGGEPDEDVLRRVLGALNREFINSGNKQRLLDIEQNPLGPLVTVHTPEQFKDPTLAALVRGLLGI